MSKPQFHDVCGARLRGRPGVRCRRSPVPGRRRCKFHGGLSPSGPRNNPRRPDAKRPGPKPRDPELTKRRKAHARLLRGADPEMATTVQSFAAPLHGAAPKPAAAPPKPAPTPAPDLPPPWPRSGYAGSLDARCLEKQERGFVRDCNTRIDLETQLLQAADYKMPPGREANQVLTAFVRERQQHVEERLALFVQAEEMFRRDGDEASRMRLARLRWEAGAYLGRLAAAKTLLVLRLEERERRDYERAYTMTETLVGDLARRAELRALRPREQGERPSSIAPWLRRS
jgi:hypothetical protein